MKGIFVVSSYFSYCNSTATRLTNSFITDPSIRFISAT